MKNITRGAGKDTMRIFSSAQHTKAMRPRQLQNAIQKPPL